MSAVRSNPDQNDHQASVDAWMDRNCRGAGTGPLLEHFDRALVVLWRRAGVTLGEVTLTAIVERVLFVASQRSPVLSSIKVEPSGPRCENLRERARGLPRDEIAEAIRFVLVELLTVIGNLTAEILTPALHAELSKVKAGEDVKP